MLCQIESSIHIPGELVTMFQMKTGRVKRNTCTKPDIKIIRVIHEVSVILVLAYQHWQGYVGIDSKESYIYKYLMVFLERLVPFLTTRGSVRTK